MENDDELKKIVDIMGRWQRQTLTAMKDAQVYGLGFLAVTDDGAVTNIPIEDVFAWATEVKPLVQETPDE